MRQRNLTSDDTDLLVSLFNAGRFHDLEYSARAMLDRHPNSGFVWKVLGLALKMQNKDALHALQKATKLLPGDAEAHNNFGNALKELGKYEDAVVSFKHALKINPSYAEAHSNMGIALSDLGKFEAAVASFRQALRFNPSLAEVHFNLGNALQAAGRNDDAIASYHQALEINPNYAAALSNLGISQQEVGQFEDAVINLRQAIMFNPDFVEVLHLNLGNSLRALGRFEEALECYQHALEIKSNFVTARSNFLFTLQFSSAITKETVFKEHRHFGEQFETPLKQHWPAHSHNGESEKRLKIGYVSGDFRRHAVANFIEPVLTNHDKSKVEVYCYSNTRQSDVITDKLKASADHWLPCATMSDSDLAQRISADGIDILVDLSGHTAHNRLLVFARKPAPIQITYLGYPGTSGLSAMDYRLTDHYTEPNDDQYYAEKLLRLPDSMWCYHPAEDMPDVTPLPALANGYLTFGSFNNFNKIDCACVELWAGLLRSLPTSRLLMVTIPDGQARTQLTHRFEALGIASDRVEYFGNLPSRQFWHKLQQVDITLDPFPVNGATTTCESLWLGVPVLTLVGERFLSRAGLSVLSAAQLLEFAAGTQEEYIQIATSLNCHLPRLAELRSNMRTHLKNTPLLDQQRFTYNLEEIYRDLWHRHVSN